MHTQLRRIFFAIVIASSATATMVACNRGEADVTVAGAEVPVTSAQIPATEAEVTIPGDAPGAQCWQDADLDYAEGVDADRDGPKTAVAAVRAMADFARSKSNEYAANERVPASDRVVAEARARSYEAILEHLDEATERSDRAGAQTFAWTDADVTVELDVRSLDGIGWHVVNERYVVPNEVCQGRLEQIVGSQGAGEGSAAG